MPGHVARLLTPRKGDPVAILPLEQAPGELVTIGMGNVDEWPDAEGSPYRVWLEPDVAQALDGLPVWVRTARVEPGGRQWFTALVHDAHDQGVVVLSDVVLAAVEARRGAVRAPLPGRASMASPDGQGGLLNGDLLDISHTGCRVRVPSAVLPVPGQAVELTATLDAGLLVTCRCSVAWVDDTMPPVVGLQFVDLPDADRRILDLSVLPAAVGAGRSAHSGRSGDSASHGSGGAGTRREVSLPRT